VIVVAELALHKFVNIKSSKLDHYSLRWQLIEFCRGLNILNNRLDKARVLSSARFFKW